MSKGHILIVSLLIFVFSFSVASAGDVLFETTMPWYNQWSMIHWGSGSLTRTNLVSIRYTPVTDQKVCTIKPGLYKSGNPTDSIVMTVRKSANNGYPINDPFIIATATVSADQMSGPPILSQQTVYTAFSFSPCLSLTANTNYSFVLSRTQLPNEYTPDLTNWYVLQASSFVYSLQTAVWGYAPVNVFWNEYVNYEPALRLEGPDTKEPVIIVPGILGSRLNQVSDGEEVWPNELKMIDLLHPDDGYLNDLKLSENGEEILDITQGDIISSTFGINQYGNLIQKFQDAGYQLNVDLFVVPYDWRLDIEVSSFELDAVVNKAIANSPTGKVNIIAHSMGGLVVKDYLMRNGDSNVNKLIFAGTPHLGSPKAFNALNWGDDFGIKFLVFGLNKNKAKEIAQNMPAVYELLPSREYISQAGSYVSDARTGNTQLLTYDQTNQFMTSDPLLPDYRNSSLLNIADQFHQFHDNWLPQTASIYNLIGCREYDTIGSFKIDSDGSVDIDSANGDGTVPLISADHIPGNKFYVSYPATKINHSGLISNNMTIDLLYDLIASDSEPTLSTGVYKTSAECDAIFDQVKRLRFSTHSPVNLHVYDSLMNHTGLTSEGNIETNIPDSNFLQVGNSSFVFVPDETEYTIKIDAYATGSFDFKIKELENGQVSESVVYDDIQINNLRLEASLEFNSIASLSPLDVDENGDGEIDVGYSSAGERILYRGIENVISDINMAYELGWITTARDRNSYLKKLEKVIKIEKKIEKIMGKLPDGSKKEKRIERLEKKIDKVLAIQFLKDLEKDYTKGRVNEQAYSLIRGDINWLLNH